MGTGFDILARVTPIMDAILPSRSFQLSLESHRRSNLQHEQSRARPRSLRLLPTADGFRVTAEAAHCRRGY
jgi:hypothetical protein